MPTMQRETRGATATGRSERTTGELHATSAAVGAVLHRLNGGLNNAVLALDVLSERPLRGTPSVLEAGRAGAEQAARAARLLAELVPSAHTSTGTEETGPYFADVYDIVCADAQRRGRNLHCEACDRPRLQSIPARPAQAAACLAALFAAIESAPPDASLALLVETAGGEPVLRIVAAR